MKINSINTAFINVPLTNGNTNKSYLNQNIQDVVSFSCKENPNKKTIPYRLESKFQDDFHITGRQVRVRSYLELQNQGLTDEEISAKMFEKTFLEGSDEDKKALVDYVKKMHKQIDSIDESFKNVVPLLMPKTYYRGVVDSLGNRAIKTVKEANVGDIIQPDLGYPFLASKKEYARSFSSYTNGESNPETCVLMIIKLPAGTPVSRDISFNTILGDKNIVLPRGVKYKVLDKEIKDGRTNITLEYLSCAMDEEK